MRKSIITLFLLAFLFEIFSSMAMAQQSVRGYTRQNGVVVQPYSRSVPISPGNNFTIPYAAFPRHHYDLDFSGSEWPELDKEVSDHKREVELREKAYFEKLERQRQFLENWKYKKPKE